jgi:uncharacterized delta-60 repeat protein
VSVLTDTRGVQKRHSFLVFAALLAAGILAGGISAARGDLDPTFGSGGKATTDFGGNEMGWAIAAQRDGKVVVAGDRFDPGPSDDFVLARYTVGGALDPGFDGDGKVTTDFNDHFSGAFGVAVQTDGKIVAAGYGFGPTGPQDFAVARYNPNGSLDGTFGAGGRVLTTFEPNSIDGGGALTIQPDGKILVGGRTRSGPTTEFGLVRYLPSGVLDPSFDGDGRVVTAMSPQNDQIFDLVVQPDGKIVAVGGVLGSPTWQLAVARYDGNGALDPSFDADGMVTVPSFPLGEHVVLQRDGRLLVAGIGGVARLNAAGTVDSGFGEGGRARIENLDPRSVALQPDGRILAIGSFFAGPTSADFAVTRLLPNGRLDGTYGRGGSVVTDFRSGSEDQALDGVLLPDGKLVVTGITRPTFNSGPFDFAVARYQAIRFCVVPNVRAKTLRAARASLTKALCKVGTVKRMYSARVKKGRVLSQRPSPRARLAENAKVNLVLSRGRRR